MLSEAGIAEAVLAALKQLAINAARHEGCKEVGLRLGERRYSVGWSAEAGRSVTT